MDLIYSGKLYAEINGEKVLGPGRIELLERIRTSGSIRQAAKEMNMSYRQAWQHIDHMNKCLTVPVVIKIRGGSGGGQAMITEKGFEMIERFKSFHHQFKDFLAHHTLLF